MDRNLPQLLVTKGPDGKPQVRRLSLQEAQEMKQRAAQQMDFETLELRSMQRARGNSARPSTAS